MQEALWATLIRAETIDTCHHVKGIGFWQWKAFQKDFLPVFVELKSWRKYKYLRRVYLMLVFEGQIPTWPIKSRNQINSFDESLMVFPRISDTENKDFLSQTMRLTT